MCVYKPVFSGNMKGFDVPFCVVFVNWQKKLVKKANRRHFFALLEPKVLLIYSLWTKNEFLLGAML